MKKRRLTRLLYCGLVAAFCLTLVGAGVEVSDAGPTKYALLIGINDYSGSDIGNLDGTQNDIALMQDILTNRLGVLPENVVKLLDTQASHENVRSAIQALTQKAKPGDMVYVHYAGHGSLTCNLQGDKSSGLDPTWVTHGSRQAAKSEPGKADCATLVAEAGNSPLPDPAAAELNKFDVLSKELNNLFHGLFKKTGNLVVVSDSCHSGTITRGPQALKTRGAKEDSRLHPYATAPAGNKPEWLQISACQDAEKAQEYKPGEKTHGLFTWFWAQALLSATPGETWENVMKRAEAQIVLAGNNSQHPSALGDKSMQIFGGRIENPPRTIAVKYVSGRTVAVAAGALAGLTRGTVLRKYDLAQKDPNALPTLKLDEVGPLVATGTADTGFAAGDLLVVEEYACDQSPVRVFVRADFKEDDKLVEQVKAMVIALKAYALASSQAECDLVLQILRPKKKADGTYILAKDNLPQSFAGEPAVCWALMPGEGEVRFIDGQDNLKTALDGKGLENLKSNLFKLARVRNLTNLTSLAGAPGQAPPVAMTIDIFEQDATPAAQCPADDTHFLEKADEKPKQCWKKTQTLPPGKAQEVLQSYSGAKLLRFTVTNTEKRPYYVYLVNITSKGKITPFYPEEWQDKAEGLLAPGQTRTLEVYLELEDPKEYVRLIASHLPVDLKPLAQESYVGTRGPGGSGLEALLDERAGLDTRGASGSTRSKPSDWSTTQTFFERAN